MSPDLAQRALGEGGQMSLLRTSGIDIFKLGGMAVFVPAVALPLIPCPLHPSLPCPPSVRWAPWWQRTEPLLWGPGGKPSSFSTSPSLSHPPTWWQLVISRSNPGCRGLGMAAGEMGLSFLFPQSPHSLRRPSESGLLRPEAALQARTGTSTSAPLSFLQRDFAFLLLLPLLFQRLLFISHPLPPPRTATPPPPLSPESPDT